MGRGLVQRAKLGAGVADPGSLDAGPCPSYGRNTEVGTQRQAKVQAWPLSVKLVGLPVLPVWVAWNPKFCEPFGVIVEL